MFGLIEGDDFSELKVLIFLSGSKSFIYCSLDFINFLRSSTNLSKFSKLY